MKARLHSSLPMNHHRLNDMLELRLKRSLSKFDARGNWVAEFWLDENNPHESAGVYQVRCGVELRRPGQKPLYVSKAASNAYQAILKASEALASILRREHKVKSHPARISDELIFEEEMRPANVG